MTLAKVIYNIKLIDKLKEFEEMIALSPWLSLDYARDVIGGRWEPGEASILTDDKAACNYAVDVIKGRWEAAEDVILASKNPYTISYYVNRSMGSRLYEAEPIILTDPMCAYWYTYHTIKGRLYAAEEIIASDAKAAYWYARDVIKDRWEAAEEVILSSPFAIDYIIDIIKLRLPTMTDPMKKLDDQDKINLFSALLT